ncbi:ribosomal protein S18-alanine N-acetyltransferase [Endozoicomonas numazuensis]|uniref:ribosomal protein S18-alanine N-acetyltransferase n=1 Tax=Endozoicomonas numazuensis TaxID=1137799 RepID=UPI0005574BBC|nr:ribosomal protein S18-alanine N-acetyltransferase [Endozoicomonas numazuensis]
MLSFRAMTHQDLPELAAIEQEAGPHPWNQKHYVDSIDSGHLCAVAEYKGKIVAQGVIMAAADEASLLILTVARKEQGKGYGSAMLQHLIESSVEKAETLFLEVRESNEKAFNLYLNAGFSEIGRRNNYYPSGKDHKSEDAIVMALDLKHF